MTGFRPPAVVAGILTVPVAEVAEPAAPKTRAAPAELDALTAVLGRLPAACADDARFTSHTPDVAALSAVCAACRVWRACEAYATAARPLAGFWAGVAYPIDDAETM